MPLPATASHRGILHPAATPFTLSRHRPAPDLAVFVERHWIVRWDLRGRAPFRQETLPHPCVNIVIERDRARVYGVETARSGQLVSAWRAVASSSTGTSPATSTVPYPSSSDPNSSGARIAHI